MTFLPLESRISSHVLLASKDLYSLYIASTYSECYIAWVDEKDCEPEIEDHVLTLGI